MKLSAKTSYAIKACVELCKAREAVGARELAKATNCSRGFLNRIMSELVGCGIAASKKGPGGGFTLSNSKVTLKAITRAVEGNASDKTVTDDVSFIEVNMENWLNITVGQLAARTREVYMDYAATTPVDPGVLSAMLPYFSAEFGNSQSVHGYGMSAGSAVDDARLLIAELIGAKRGELFFTSGGSEANNWVIKCANTETKPRRIIVSALEHPSIAESAGELAGKGIKVDVVYPDSSGVISPEKLEEMLAGGASLVSVMTANNEIGTIQNVRELCRIAHAHGALFHTDAVQAAGCMALNVKDTGVDYMSVSAHKFYGPKGIGCLFVKKGAPITPLITGGHQERSRRGGTTNVPAVIGMAKALEISRSKLEEENDRIRRLRDALERGITESFPFAKVNGSGAERVPSNLSVTFKGRNASSIISLLDVAGVAVSAGAACSSGSIEPSKVLSAIGLCEKDALGTIRFSLGRYTTREDVEFVIETLKSVIKPGE